MIKKIDQNDRLFIVCVHFDLKTEEFKTKTKILPSS